jgi:hypothetical protein
MLYVIIAQAAVYIFDFLFYDRGMNIYGLLAFNRDLILSGQIWRVITFVFLPDVTNPIIMFFFMYLYYMIGQALEREWGGFYFNAFYFLGVIFSIIGGFITGFASIEYINLSLFLAFAALFPNMKFLLFFIIPIKVKYLAIVDLVLLGLSLLMGTWAVRVAVLISLLNVVIFFWDDFYPKIKNKWRFRKIRSQWK